MKIMSKLSHYDLLTNASKAFVNFFFFFLGTRTFVNMTHNFKHVFFFLIIGGLPYGEKEHV